MTTLPGDQPSYPAHILDDDDNKTFNNVKPHARTVSQRLYVSNTLQPSSLSSTCTTSTAPSDATRPSSLITESQFPSSAVKSIDLLQDTFTQNFRTGVRISSFCDDLQVLQHGMKIHGLPSFNMNISECRKTLICHILKGYCSSYDTNVATLPRHPDHTGCYGSTWWELRSVDSDPRW